MRLLLLLSLLVLLIPAVASAAIQTRTLPVPYGKDPAGVDIVGECQLVWNDEVKGKQPTVLVFPEWMGLGDYAKGRARQLAEMGYVAVAVDIYGDGKVASDTKEAAEWSGHFKSDRNLVRARTKAVLEMVRKLNEVDPSRIGAIGYCFGGLVALELARSGSDIRGVVTFHGDLSSPTPADAKAIKARILVCHGAVDPLVPAPIVAGFMEEMNTAGVDYVFIAYAKAVHSFTNPNSGSDPGKGVAYNREADARSFAAMKQFFQETFK